MEIKRERDNGRIEISQEACITQMCSRDLGCPSVSKAVATPADGILCRISAENGGRAGQVNT